MLQTRLAGSRGAAPLARLAARLSPATRCSSARPFSSTHARGLFGSAPFVPPDEGLRMRLATPVDPSADSRSKIEAWPFEMDRERALELSEMAAAAAVGPGVGLRMGLHFYAKRLFGWEGFKPHVNMIALKALNIPVWFVDVSATATAVMGNESYDLTIESFRVPIPGFNFPPLSSMPIRPPPDDPVLQWKGPDTPTGEPSAQTIPFTRHPLGIVQKLKALPRRVARDEDDVGFDPSRVKFRMMASYATYIPLWLGEWEVESPAFESGTTRVTTAFFGDSQKTRFCVYRQKTPDEEPEWRPAPASAFELDITARPSSYSAAPFQDGLVSTKIGQVFGARLKEAIDEIKEEREDMGEGFVDWTDAVPESGIQEFAAKEDRVCSYKWWSETNEAYAEALRRYESARAFYDQLKDTAPDRMNLTVVRPSLRSPVQRGNTAQLLRWVKESVDEWRELVDESKPAWLKRAEEKEKSVIGRETSKIRARERGRRVN